ncbi:MAG: tetratricopeptide repeat protein [Gemmatimonadaceae bacterium]|nr:tetratricopeptide repeat protein [Chitinophagaceae bacterium]
MKKLLSSFALSTLVLFAAAQQTKFIDDPQATLKQAREYFQKENYSLAYPLFKELSLQLRETDRSNQAFNYQDIRYYTTVCALKQNEPAALDAAREFIDMEDNEAKVQLMSFHLGEYYFRQKDFYQAISSYSNINIENLSNREIADMKFHQGYSYFNLQRFDEAKTALNDIRSNPKDPNYVDANYYYGVLVFNERKYKEALTSFEVAEKAAQYEKVVPFYIATIHYNTGQKEKALQYAESKLKSGGQAYDMQMRQLVGHAYYEKQEYTKALPYLEGYVNKAEKLRREDIYELSYTYYQAKNYNKAIEGFKKLGGKEDSLAQNAMYLLADSYLKTNQKANARNAFLFCAANISNPMQREVSKYNYAKLSYELGYQDVALTELRKFLEEYPNSEYNKEAKELLVGVLAISNNYRDALTLVESLSNPSEIVKREYAKILYGRATELVNDGLLIGANDLLDKALKEPYNQAVLPYVNFWKGEISYRLNRIDDAIRFYFEYLKSGAVNGEVNPLNAKYNLGYSFLKRENYKQAVNFFEQIVTTPKINSSQIEQDAYIRSADCYYMNREFTKALAMYDKVLSFSWASSDYALFQKAMVAGVKSGSEKVKLLQNIQRVYPTSSLVPDANLEIANSYLSDEKYREAIPFLKNVVNGVQNESLKPRALLKLGIANYNLNNNKEALTQYNALLKQYPSSPEAEEALDNAKTIYVEEGRTSEYVSFARGLGRDISTNQEDSLAYAEAEVQFNNGNFNGALSRFENYLSKFPDGKYSLESYYYSSEIYFNRKDWAKAAAGYEKVSDRVPNKFGEKSLVQAARLNFFDLKDYNKAETYFTKLKEFASNQENKLEAMRGLLRSQYQLQKWSEAAENSKDLLNQKGSNADDKVLANMALARSAQSTNNCDGAIAYYRSVVTLNKAGYAAEARYEIANCQLQQNKLKDAEKSAFEVINKSGSYGDWVTKAYLLLGDVYFKQKDFFNAKATFQSVADNATLPQFKDEALRKLKEVTEEERKENRVDN